MNYSLYGKEVNFKKMMKKNLKKQKCFPVSLTPKVQINEKKYKNLLGEKTEFTPNFEGDLRHKKEEGKLNTTVEANFHNSVEFFKDKNVSPESEERQSITKKKFNKKNKEKNKLNLSNTSDIKTNYNSEDAVLESPKLSIKKETEEKNGDNIKTIIVEENSCSGSDNSINKEIGHYNDNKSTGFITTDKDEGRNVFTLKGMENTDENVNTAGLKEQSDSEDDIDSSEDSGNESSSSDDEENSEEDEYEYDINTSHPDNLPNKTSNQNRIANQMGTTANVRG